MEFIHIINKSEANAHYLNLRDKDGTKYGSKIGEHGTLYTVVDGMGRRSIMKRHGKNQLTKCSRWFQENQIIPDTLVLIQFDPFERDDGRKVLHIAKVRSGEGVAKSDMSSIKPPYDNLFAKSLSVANPSLEIHAHNVFRSNPELLEPGLKLCDENFNSRKIIDAQIFSSTDLLCERRNGELLIVCFQSGKNGTEIVGKLSEKIGWIASTCSNGRSVRGLLIATITDPALEYAIRGNPLISLRQIRLTFALTPEKVA